MGRLLSIVIPTRNREKYCIEAIKHIMTFMEDCFELVIKDNSDSDIIEQYVSKNPDIRLKYHRTQGRINSVINMDEALSYAQGEYVCMIGDDDTILPNIFSVARWAKENEISAITPSGTPAFYWNEDFSLFGTLLTQPVSFHHQTMNAPKQLSLLLKRGCIDYQRYNLPRVYHGIIKRNVLLMIKEKAGHIIGGLSPDIYLSVASCFYIDKYVLLSFPISIAGACKLSTSVGDNRTCFEKTPHLWNRGLYSWNEYIPKYNTNETIWGETALKAIEEHDTMRNYLKLFNRDYFMYVFWHNNNDIRYVIEKETGLKKKYSIKNSFLYYLGECPIIMRAVKKRLLNQRRIVRNIGSWQVVVNKYLKYQSGLSF